MRDFPYSTQAFSAQRRLNLINLQAQFRRRFTERAARMGVHVLCEKPMDTSLADCDAMIEVTRERGVKLMIGYLGVNETGTDVLPPMASRVNWTAVGFADGALLLVFIATNISMALTYSRLSVGRTLRIGEL